jgi:DNA helicase II / ATP-dependent DNA helicase PcrA
MTALATQDPPYLAGLNPPQRDAVLTADGPVLMLAGAGTGKTKALTARLAHLLSTGRAWPGQILAVTFTNKAAREMQHRVGGLIGEAVEGMTWLGTFHAVAAKMLRRHAELVGLKSSFAILDMDDQLRLLKQLIQASNIDEKRWPARLLASEIDRWKNRGWTPEMVPTAERGGYADGKGLEFYAAYQARLKTLNACDFGDLLLHMLVILQKNPDVLADYHRRFKYILVDEYQDTNVAQYLWLRLLAQRPDGGPANICCVGDDDQSIYGWRGAEVGNILRFEKDFPGAKVIRLEQNYRSGPHILGAASGLIAANRSRLGKTLWTDEPHGEKVEIIGVWDGAEEARLVADRLETMRARAEPLNKAAVLVRAMFQTRELEERFITVNMPYRIVGGLRFYERAEIRDALAYLRVIASPDDDLAFERIVNTPKRGLGDKVMQKLHHVARTAGVSLQQAAAQLVASDEITPSARRGLGGLLEDFTRWRGNLEAIGHVELTRTVLEESGYAAMLQADKSAQSAGRLDNLNELIDALEEFDTLSGFLEHVSLVMDNDASDNGAKVTMMSMHGAKGLEFDTVFLAGWEEGVFPSQRSLDEGGLAALEEERRLAYVGLTRARHRAIITHVANRRIYNQWQSAIPSRFLEELPSEHVSRETTITGRYGTPSWMSNDDPFADAGRSGGRGPGWQRAAQSGGFGGQSRESRIAAARVIEGRADRLTATSGGKSKFATGARVFHDKFGYGVVTAVDGNKLDVSFESAGPKRVVDSFVQAA